jgi:hypothetical protein
MCYRIRQNAHNKKVKEQTISEYGGKCAHCLESNIVFLTLDHIDNNGPAHRKELQNQTQSKRKFTGGAIYVWLKHNNYPRDNYQVLCFNCNYKKYIAFIHDVRHNIGNETQSRIDDNICIKCQCALTASNWPLYLVRKCHRICITCKNEQHRIEKAQLKYTVMQHYGSKCVCCNENDMTVLNIDHINEDGAEHRRLLTNGINSAGARGTAFYRWLRRQGYPQSNYQVLCFNCNFAKHFLGMCPHSTNMMEDTHPK